MHTGTRSTRIRRAPVIAAATIAMAGLLPALASADPAQPPPPPTSSTPPPAAPSTPPPAAPSTTAPTPAPSPTTPPTSLPPSPARPTTTGPAPTTGTPPGSTRPTTAPVPRLTVGAVRIVDENGAAVPGATAFVQGCTGGPGATLGDGGATTVVGPCVRASMNSIPTNWRLLTPSSQTVTTDSGRVEFRFVLARGGIVPPTSTTPPPNRNVRFTLSARDQDGRGVPSEYAVAECNTWRPVGGARTDSGGDGGGAFPGDCVSVVPTAWPSSCVLLGPHAYARVEGNGVNRLSFRFRCAVVVPPGEGAHEGTLVKTDRITGAPLAGASFVISRCGSDEAIRAITTAGNGVAAFALPPGCYRATETAAPAGYLREAASIAFQAGPRFEVAVTNSKIEAGPVVRNPGVRVPISSIPSGPVLR